MVGFRGKPQAQCLAHGCPGFHREELYGNQGFVDFVKGLITPVNCRMQEYHRDKSDS